MYNSVDVWGLITLKLKPYQYVYHICIDMVCVWVMTTGIDLNVSCCTWRVTSREDISAARDQPGRIHHHQDSWTYPMIKQLFTNN